MGGLLRRGGRGWAAAYGLSVIVLGRTNIYVVIVIAKTIKNCQPNPSPQTRTTDTAPYSGYILKTAMSTKFRSLSKGNKHRFRTKGYSTFAEDISRFLHNRPRLLVRVMARYKSDVDEEGIKKIKDGEFRVKNSNGIETYTVHLGSVLAETGATILCYVSTCGASSASYQEYHASRWGQYT